jgi:hypothetical protein
MAAPIQSANVGQPRDLARTARVDVLRVVVLGLNAWIVLLFLPWVLATPTDPTTVFWLCAPLVVLAMGAPSIPSQRLFAAWMLLGAFPVLCAFVVAWMPQLTEHPPHGTWSHALGALSLVAFGAGAATAVGRPERVRSSTRRPLGTVAPVEERSERRRGRRVLVAVATTAAFAMALIAPAVGDQSGYVRAWGEASREAATLAAVIGGGLGAALLSLIVGPGLRASRSRAPTARQANRRALTMLGLFAIGLALYVFYVTAR